MKVTLAKSAGFCFGVRRAIDIALKVAKEKNHVCMLGDIVHNDTVVETIKNAGIAKISRLGAGGNKTLLVRAHGISLDTYKKAGKKGYHLIDATCPMVKEIHRIARKAEKDGYKIAVVGDPRHEEVKGIVGQLRARPVILSKRSDIAGNKFKKTQRLAVVVQSTQNIDTVLKIVQSLERMVGDLSFFNTICRPTRQKQKEAKELALKNDVIIVLGSRKSANTRRLYEIAKDRNKNTHWVESLAEIKKSWFRKAQTVGILAGASTPDEIITDAVALVRSIKFSKDRKG